MSDTCRLVLTNVHNTSASARVKPKGFGGLFPFALALTALVLSPSLSWAQSEQPPFGMFSNGPFNTNMGSRRLPVRSELIVNLRSGLVGRWQSDFKRKNRRMPSAKELNRILAKNLGVVGAKYLGGNAVSAKISRTQTARTVLAKSRRVARRVDRNYRVFSFNSPNEQLYQSGLLWGLNNVIFGVNADVDAPEAWEITTGSPNVIVAVIDTGVMHTHKDLRSSMWVNPGEIPGNNIDDDRNGFIDDVHGYDFVARDGDPMDENMHGTHVAGIIAAQGGNGVSIVGVAPGVKIIGLRVLNANGEGDTAEVIEAMRYAIMMRRRGVPIRVINASFGGGDEVDAFRDAIREAAQAGIVVVVAAGNDSSDNDTKPLYPANYRFPGTLTVAAVNYQGALSSFSNYGVRSVDVAAPGDLILSTIINDWTFPLSGTSMATPFVSGVAALVASRYPNMSPVEIADRIRRSVKYAPGLRDKIINPGIPSAVAALRGEAGPDL